MTFVPALRRQFTIPHGTLTGYRYWKCHCHACRKVHAESHADLRASRIVKGLCLRCGLPSRPHKVTCLRCGLKDAARSLARYHAKKSQKQTEAA